MTALMPLEEAVTLAKNVIADFYEYTSQLIKRE